MARIVGPLMGAPGDSTRRTSTAELPLGTVAYGEAGKEYEYVKAGGAIAQYAAVSFESGGGTVVESSALTGYLVGVADAAFSSGQYGFVQTRGQCTAKVVNSTTALLPIGPCATAGVLDDVVETTPAGGSLAVALATGAATGSLIYLR